MANSELVIHKGNLSEIRKNGLIVNTTPVEMIDLYLSKVISDTYIFFNTQFNESIVNMIIESIQDQYKLYSFAEIIQAIKNGRLKQSHIYGKLAPAHFMEWLKDWSELVTDFKHDLTSEIKSRSKDDKSDKYANSEMSKDELKIFKKLADKWKIENEDEKKKKKIAGKQSVLEILKQSEENKERLDYRERWWDEEILKNKGMTLEQWMKEYDQKTNKVD